MKKISVILPTYNERENIQKLVPLLCGELKKLLCEYEILVMDDNSPDLTWKVAEDLKEKYPVKVIRRYKERGISAAVIEGFENAEGDVLVVMDADFSHPYQTMALMIHYLKQGYNLVIGSKFIQGGETEQSFYRKLVSDFSRSLIRPLSKVRDPLSGFFALKKEVIDKKVLSKTGWKIGLEIIVKGNHNKCIKEVPINFKNREFGESKANFRVFLSLLIHLIELYIYKYFRNLGPG